MQETIISYLVIVNVKLEPNHDIKQTKLQLCP